MFRKPALLPFVALLLFVPMPGICDAPKQLPVDAKCKYKPGQVWTYKTRPGEEASRVSVLSVERFERVGTVVHIGLNKLKIKLPKSKTGFSEIVEHIPISEKALDESVLKKEAEGPLKSAPRGHKDWREQFDLGKAGVFTIPLADCIQFIEKTLNSTNYEGPRR